MKALTGVALGVLLTIGAALVEIKRLSDGGDPSPVSVAVGAAGLVLSVVCAVQLVAPEQRRTMALVAGLPFLLVGVLTAALLALR